MSTSRTVRRFHQLVVQFRLQSTPSRSARHAQYDRSSVRNRTAVGGELSIRILPAIWRICKKVTVKHNSATIQAAIRSTDIQTFDLVVTKQPQFRQTLNTREKHERQPSVCDTRDSLKVDIHGFTNTRTKNSVRTSQRTLYPL